MRYDSAFAPVLGFLHCYGESSAWHVLKLDQPNVIELLLHAAI